jgi:hypothetical protein
MSAMPKQRQEIVRHTFKGGRFEDHGLDLDVLPELVAYKAILLAVAKELWHRNNPDRERLPANFEKLFSIKMFSLEPGSVCVPLCREIERGEQLSLLDDESNELQQAARLIADLIGAAGRDEPLPSAFPASKLSLFETYGKSLQDGESFVITLPDGLQPVEYTRETRQRLEQLAARSYEDSVDVTGAVTMARISSPRMTITLRDGRSIESAFRSQDEDAVTTALKKHSTVRLRARGRGIFSPNGELQRIVELTHVELLEGEVPTFSPGVVPIWRVFEQIMQSVPSDQIDLLPPDAASQHDHYLYGTPKSE